MGLSQVGIPTLPSGAETCPGDPKVLEPEPEPQAVAVAVAAQRIEGAVDSAPSPIDRGRTSACSERSRCSSRRSRSTSPSSSRRTDAAAPRKAAAPTAGSAVPSARSQCCCDARARDGRIGGRGTGGECISDDCVGGGLVSDD